MSEQVQIGTVPKSQRSEIRVSAKVYEGKPFVDVRLWALNPDQDGLVPTKKGITVNPNQIPQLIELLQRAQEEAEKLS